MSLTGPVKLRDREYMGTVHSIKLNEDYAAVLFENKVQLHTVSLLQLPDCRSVIYIKYT